MRTSEQECIDALREAARRLDASPTKAEYEDLDVTPASTTIVRVFGSWNEAKDAAGLQTFEQGENGGIDVTPEPEWVEIPEGVEWTELSPQQRWYYKNRKARIETKEERRRELRRWFYELKRDEFVCTRCPEARPPALDFHHDGEKEGNISAMVNDGYSRSRIRDEMERCVVLCANCHRKEHHEKSHPATRLPADKIESRVDDATTHEARRLRRAWLFAYKRGSDGCSECAVTSPECLDFHHTGAKSMRIGAMVSFDCSLSEIRHEIEQCVLLCANCHRSAHFNRPMAPA
jgi:hypothetical protein